MIITTLGTLATAGPALKRLCDIPRSPKAAYHVAKLARLVDQELQHLDTQRNAYVRELGTIVDGQLQIPVGSPNWATWEQRMTELLAVPIEISWNPLTLEMLGDQPLTATDLLALGPLLADGEPEIAAS